MPGDNVAGGDHRISPAVWKCLKFAFHVFTESMSIAPSQCSERTGKSTFWSAANTPCQAHSAQSRLRAESQVLEIHFETTVHAAAKGTHFQIRHHEPPVRYFVISRRLHPALVKPFVRQVNVVARVVAAPSPVTGAFRSSERNEPDPRNRRCHPAWWVRG